MDDELRATVEDRQYMAKQLLEGFEAEHGADANTLMDLGILDRNALLGLLAEAMERMEVYLITS